MANRLTIKGQVTIPKDVREFLGLQAGASRVEFTIDEDGSVRVVKAADAPRDAIAQLHRSTVRSRRRTGREEENDDMIQLRLL